MRKAIRFLDMTEIVDADAKTLAGRGGEKAARCPTYPTLGILPI
jgi:hypothetical protein